MSCEEAPHPYLEAPHLCPVLWAREFCCKKRFFFAAEGELSVTAPVRGGGD